MTPGEILRQLRKEQSMSQHQLAIVSGVSREWLASVELGRIPSPGASLLAKLARGLRMTTSELISVMGIAPMEPTSVDPKVTQEIQRFVQLVSQLDQPRREAVIAYMKSINALLG